MKRQLKPVACRLVLLAACICLLDSRADSATAFEAPALVPRPAWTKDCPLPDILDERPTENELTYLYINCQIRFPDSPCVTAVKKTTREDKSLAWQVVCGKKLVQPEQRSSDDETYPY